MQFPPLLTCVLSSFLFAPALAAPTPAAAPFTPVPVVFPPQSSTIERRAAGEEQYLVDCIGTGASTSHLSWYSSPYTSGRYPDDARRITEISANTDVGLFKWNEKAGTTWVLSSTNRFTLGQLNAVSDDSYAGTVKNSWRSFRCVGGEWKKLYESAGMSCYARYKCT